MSQIKISELPAGIPESNAVVPATNAAGNQTSKIKLGDIVNLPHNHDDLYYTEAETNALLGAKAPLANPTFTGNISGITKSMVGLGNVDNTTDANKPVSTAAQTALESKAPLASPTFTGTVNGITKGMVGLGNVDNTSDASKPVSTAQASADSAVASTAATDATTKANAAQSYAIQRSNHTGTQAIGTINGLQTALDSKQASGNYATLINGLIPAVQLPSYVDDVIEAANLAALPATGESGKIYVTLDSNKTYRWSGNTYIEISASPGSTDAVPEGSINKYHTDARASAAAPVQSVAGRTGVVTLTSSDISGLTESIESTINTSLVAGTNIDLDYDNDENTLSISTKESPTFSTVNLTNNSSLSQGSFDSGMGGNGGISLNCVVGYELNWQASHLKNIIIGDETATPQIIYFDSPITYSPATLEIPYHSNINIDASSAEIFDVLLTGNVILDNPTNPVNGKTIRWRITQDATGNRAVTLGSKFNIPSSASSPLPWSTVANKMDVLAATYHQGRDKWDVVAFVPGY